MIKIAVGGEIDVHAIRRMVRTDEMLVGYPAGVKHPAVVGYVRTKTGRLSKKKKYSALLSNLENATLAEWLHDGTATIPARPFLMQGIGSEMTRIRAAIKEYHLERMRGKEGNLAKIGAIAVGAVQRFVRGGYYKAKLPNAPGTIAGKRSDTPLIDMGFLINSTTFVVRNLKKLPDQRGKQRLEA